MRFGSRLIISASWRVLRSLSARQRSSWAAMAFAAGVEIGPGVEGEEALGFLLDAFLVLDVAAGFLGMTVGG